MALLRAAASAAARGQGGGVVLVTGPAGIGKTRLVEEALRAEPAPAGTDNGRVPVGRGYCLAERAAPPLWPWRQALRALARAALPAAGLGEIGALLDEAARTCAASSVEAAHAAGAADARFATLAEVADKMLATATAAPAVVVLEDLQWADAHTVELVRQVAGGIRDSRLLLVATLRTQEAPGAAFAVPDETMGVLARLDTVQLLGLPPLGAAAAQEYLAVSAGADDATFAQMTLELARARYDAGQVSEALRLCDEVAAAAARTARPDLVAAAALLPRWVTYPEAIEVITRLCRMALASDQPPLVRSQLLSQLATVVGNTGAVAEAREHSDEALALAEQAGDGQTLLDAARAREMTLVGPDDSEERLRLADVVALQADRLNQPLAAVLGQQWRIRAAYQLGRLDAVDDAMTAAAALADRCQLPLVRWHQRRAVAARAELEGRFAAAREADLAAHQLARRSGDLQGVGLSYAFRQHLAMLRWDAAELPDDYWTVLDATPRNPLLDTFRANNHLLLGQLDEARGGYERLRRMLDRPVVDARWGGVLTQFIYLVEAFGDAEAGAALAEHLRPWAAYPGALGIATVFFVGCGQGHYGRALACAGELAAAETALHAAIEADLALGARPHIVLNRLALVGVLRRRADGAHATGAGRVEGAADVAGSAAKARTLAAEARALAAEAAAEARRLDMPGPLARADRLLAELDAARRAGDPLTTREREVATLVAAALSNREIASRLVLSERTVESHVRSILGKLGYANRAELIARWRPA
ncbi:hypothetical protein BCD48_14120 [Pseudofrankia sp. BMG5.36]|nr:hypothetical protein BCD48_14120 [Pseudofrankia sp. BMG5.36]